MNSLDSYRFLSTDAILAETGLSRTTLYKFIREGKILENIHFIRWGGNAKKSGKTHWNSLLIKDRLVHFDDDRSHQKAIDAYLKSLPSNQSR